MYQTMAINLFTYLCGAFPTVEQFAELNETYQTGIKNAIMWQINYMEQNQDIFFSNNGSEISSVSLGRFSISPTNAENGNQFSQQAQAYLVELGFCHGNRALNRIAGCWCYV